MRPALFYGIVIAFAFLATGQEFEAVSVKPNKSGSGSSRSSSDQGMLRATNLRFRDLIQEAFDVKEYQVEGPDWMLTERFDITAKFPDDLPRDRERRSAAFRTMMQKMLGERFMLKVHWDHKTIPVFGLTVAKGKIKFKEVVDTGSHHSDGGNNTYSGTGVTMATLAEFLSRREDLPVIDMTGLKGFYNLKLDWAPDQSNDDALRASPSLSEALEDQLGLRLQNRKTSIQVVVVDQAERTPTEN